MITRRGMLAGAAGLAATQAAAATPESLWSAEYTAKKGAVSLALYRRRASQPKAGEAPLPVLFLIHGSSLSARSSYDVTLPGAEEYSMLNVFARLGYDVWTMDCENYGKSSRTESNSDIASGAADIAAGLELIAKETRRTRVHLFGESSGGLRVALFAAQHPDKVDRVVLAAYTYKGEGSPTLAKRAEQLDYYKTHNRRLRDRDMIRSIYTRDKPGVADPKIAEAVADRELKFGDQVPTGTYLDMTAHLPVVEPEKVLAPVLMLRGEYDGIATMSDLSDFFNRLPNGDRQFVILAGCAHSLVSGLNRKPFWHAIHSFLTTPAALRIS